MNKESAFKVFAYIAVCCVTLGILSSCSKGPEIYRAIDDRSVLTLRDRGEAELSDGGSSYVGAFTREGNRIRVVVSVFGSQQAVYFERIDEGLKDLAGDILYNAKQYPQVMERILAQKKQLELDKQLLSEADWITLSPKTIGLLKTLKKPITVTVFFSARQCTL